MDFETLSNWIRERAGEDDISEIEEFLNSTSSSIADSANYKEASEGKISELNENITSLTTENDRLKAANYDLLMQLPTDEGVEPEPVVEDETVKSIDDLFE